MVAIVHRLAIVGLGDLDDTYGGRGVFWRHGWERAEGKMETVRRKMVREKSKRDRWGFPTDRRLRSDESVGAKSTWLAPFSLNPEIYLRSTSLPSGAQKTAWSNRKHSRR